jgi:uncharacterized membrane protein
MKAFWTYTLARIAVFVGIYAVTWGIASLIYDVSFDDLFATNVGLVVLLIAAVLSSVISIVALGGLRDRLATNIEQRATRIADRIEESRSAEDVD